MVFLVAEKFMIFAQTTTDTLTKNNHKKITYGLEVIHLANNNLNYTNGFSFATAATFHKGRVVLLPGFVWSFDRNKKVNILKGGTLSAEFYPFKNNRIINFYFKNDLSLTYEKDRWNRYMKTINYTDYYHVKFNSVWHSLQEQIGYGFNLDLNCSFYLTSAMTIGFEFYNYKSNTIVEEDPSLSSQYSTGNIFSDVNTKGYLMLGIGYSFK